MSGVGFRSNSDGARILWRVMVLFALPCVPVLLFSGCGATSSDSVPERNLRWSVFEAEGPRDIVVGGSVPQCEGLPDPQVSEVVKRYEGGRMYLRVVVEVPADAHDEEFVCAGSGFNLTETVHLRRDIADLVLFDSGRVPAVQRWPEE